MPDPDAPLPPLTPEAEEAGHDPSLASKPDPDDMHAGVVDAPAE